MNARGVFQINHMLRFCCVGGSQATNRTMLTGIYVAPVCMFISSISVTMDSESWLLFKVAFYEVYNKTSARIALHHFWRAWQQTLFLFFRSTSAART